MESYTCEQQAEKPIEAVDFDHPIRPPDMADDVKRLLRLVAHRRRPSEEFLTRVRKLIVTDDPELGSAPALFDRTVWGHVRWARSVGRPKTAHMADAFTFDHLYHFIQDNGVDADGNVIDVSKWVQATIPHVWDGPHDDQHYRVSYMLLGAVPWKNALGVNLQPETQWEPPIPPWLGTRRAILYPATLQWGMFDVKRTGITELDDIEVVRLLG